MKKREREDVDVFSSVSICYTDCRKCVSLNYKHNPVNKIQFWWILSGGFITYTCYLSRLSASTESVTCWAFCHVHNFKKHVAHVSLSSAIRSSLILSKKFTEWLVWTLNPDDTRRAVIRGHANETESGLALMSLFGLSGSLL